MSFPNMTTSYGKNGGSGDSHNPYARAAAAWDERIGSARVQARNWRYIAFASMALALISTSGAVVLGVKKQVATYVVEVDKAGMPGRITLASEPYRPATAQVGYFVGEVVRLVRERPLDPVVMRQQWTKAYQFLAGQAVNAMNEYAASDSGMKNLARRRRDRPHRRNQQHPSKIQRHLSGALGRNDLFQRHAPLARGIHRAVSGQVDAPAR